MTDLYSFIGIWLVGLVTGIAIRIGRERQAELRGIAIGRRQGWSQAYRQ